MDEKKIETNVYTFQWNTLCFCEEINYIHNSNNFERMIKKNR